MRHNVAATANATAITVGFIYIACAALVAFFPEFSKTVMISWFHGIDLGSVWTGEARGNFILGLATAMGGSWLIGFVFAQAYNKFVK